MPDTLSHAQIARQVIGSAPAGVFAHAARDAVIHGEFTTLQRMLPGVVFATRKVDSDDWELVGTCADGSVVLWRVGG